MNVCCCSMRIIILCWVQALCKQIHMASFMVRISRSNNTIILCAFDIDFFWVQQLSKMIQT